MQRIIIEPRPTLSSRAAAAGFTFATIDGEIYWDERAYYSFTLREIETDLENPSAELHALCLHFVDRAVGDERILTRLAIPEHAWPLIAESWRRRDPTLYGRLDLAYDGNGPAKLLEYNADTPTALFEAAYFQWGWLEDSIASGTLPPAADQFNSIQEALIKSLSAAAAHHATTSLHLAFVTGSAEDQGLIAYLTDCALQAGLAPVQLTIDTIGSRGHGPFVDQQSQPILQLFKLYPWEWMWTDAFSRSPSMRHTRFLEPPWKAVLSNKGMLPFLWEMALGHPNLLPAYFSDDPARERLGNRYAAKPLYSREGNNVTLVDGSRIIDQSDGPYAAQKHIWQALAPMPVYDGNTPVIGSWIIDGHACGIGIREDRSLITKDTSRFIPHVIID